jgi:hypothetical protein
MFISWFLKFGAELVEFDYRIDCCNRGDNFRRARWLAVFFKPKVVSAQHGTAISALSQIMTLM